MSGSSPKEAPLKTFWNSFQLFPRQMDNAILSRRRWIVLGAMGPLLLLVIESALIDLSGDDEIRASFLFRDLRDPIFTYISLALLVGGWAFVQFWRSDLEGAFQSVIDNKLLQDDENGDVVAAYHKFLKDYQRRLHRLGRYLPFIISAFVGIGASIVALSARGFTLADLFPFGSQNNSWLEGLHLLTRWFLAPVVWAYFFGLAAWALGATSRTIRQLIEQFRPRIWPSHPDKIGGLKPISDLCMSAGLVMIVVLIPFTFFGARTISFIQATRCVSRMESNVFMGKEELATCFVRINHAFGDTAYTYETADSYIQELLDRGISTSEIVQRVLLEESNLSRQLQSENWVYIFLFIASMVGLLLFVIFIIWPLWALYDQMGRRRRAYETMITSQIIALDKLLAENVQKKDLKKVAEIKGELETLLKLHPDAIGYPTLPIRFPTFIGKILTPSVLMTAVTFLLSLLNVTISDTLRDVLSGLMENIN